jgi:hypothetical protein
MNIEQSIQRWAPRPPLKEQVKPDRFEFEDTRQWTGGCCLQKCESRSDLSQMTDLTEVTSFSGPLDEQPLNDVVDDGTNKPLDAISVVKNEFLSSASALSSPPDDLDLPQGMPHEITLVNELAIKSADSMDVHQRLKAAESLVESYKETLRSTDHLLDSLHQNLLDAQGKAEDILTERNDLLNTIQEMEEIAIVKRNEFLLLNAIMSFGLFFYLLCGGSEFLLIALYLFDGFLNATI